MRDAHHGTPGRNYYPGGINFPLFFDASLPLIEKSARWRTQPVTSLQLVTNVMLLSLLAVGVASVG
jgi:hypothetical protein